MPGPLTPRPLTDLDGSAGLAALVLCGGQSRRMGRDKAGLVLGASTLLERAVATVRALTPDVLLACGPRPRYAELGVPLVLDRRADAGPLAGLEAGLSAASADLVLVLACDMPHADRETLAALVEIARRERLDVALVHSDNGLEPLCAVWSTRMAHAVRAALDAGEHNVTRAFDQPLADGTSPRVRAVSPSELPASEIRAGQLPRSELRRGDLHANVNTPADLERERTARGAGGAARGEVSIGREEGRAAREPGRAAREAEGRAARGDGRATREAGRGAREEGRGAPGSRTMGAP
jgi:molybdopterin-guanine dinucleotide biosynthesis protein A